MWLITPIGFYSIVQRPSDQQFGTLTVCSRVHSDLVALKQHFLPGLGPIEESPDTDYRFQATARHAEVSAAMFRMVDGLDYSNAKLEIANRQGRNRSDLYQQALDVLRQLQPEVDGCEHENGLAAQPKYLGSPEVVTELIKEIVSVAIYSFIKLASNSDVSQAVGKVVSAFTRDDAGFTRMPAWHSAEQLGRNVEHYLVTGSNQEDCLANILGQGMTSLIAKVQELLRGFLNDTSSNREEHTMLQLKAIRQFVVDVLLGTNTVVHGEKTLCDFHWIQQAVLENGCPTS